MIKSQNRPKITWAITAVIIFAIWFFKDLIIQCSKQPLFA